MPRITPLKPENVSGPAKELLGVVESKLGGKPNLMTTAARSPAVLNAYLQFSGALGEASLSAGVREQIALAIANANRCEYCAAAHTVLGGKAGLSADQAVAAQRGEAEDPKTRAILSLALQINEKRGWISDEDFRAATDAGVSEAEILETVAVVVLNILTNYLNHVAGTEVDFPKVALIETASA